MVQLIGGRTRGGDAPMPKAVAVVGLLLLSLYALAVMVVPQGWSWS